MIQLNSINLSFGGRQIFEDLSLNLSVGEKLALIGRNGTGKSTLLKMIMGELESDSGHLSVSKNYDIGYLRQHISFTQDSLIKECTQGGYFDYQAEKLLFGLGFTKEDLEKDPHQFSGGFQLRIELVKCLIQEPNLLLLDEPTNYLDITSIRWLQDFLKRYQGEIIIVSHDRTFLDSVCTHTAGVYLRKLRKVKGSTKKFYEQLSQEKDNELKTKENVERRKKELQGFVDRFRSKARQASQAQSKLKQIEKLNQITFSQDEKHFSGFKFRYKNFEAKTFIDAKDLSFYYTKEIPLIDDLSFSIKNGARLAIIGKNGKGKSTLLKLLASLQNQVAGELYFHPKIQSGYFGQTNIERMSAENTITDEIYSENSDLAISDVRGICGAMAFSGDDADKKIKVLSGGEKARVLLGKILARPCNLLLLDEPTHHLDLESIQVLLKEIKSFPGAVVVVTHDEYLLENFASEIIAFHRDKVEYFPYSYEEFIEKVGWDDGAVKKEVVKKLSYKEQKEKRAQIVKMRSTHLRPVLKEIEKVEEKISELEEKGQDCQTKLIEASSSSQGEAIEKLSIESGQIEKEIEQLFEKLEELSEKKEELEKLYPLD